VKAFVEAYRWKGPVFAVSAVNGEGCRELVFAIARWLAEHPAPLAAADETLERES
jgi:GTP-binding protein